ncbi:guanylate kinase [bacterium]|nr:guanylate kinase [bacterium]
MPHKSQGAQPRLIIISAPSGAGKTTLCDLLLKDFSQIQQSVSTTTRPQRPHEINGQHYFFITSEEFEKKKLAGEFAEWAEVHGNFYGTRKQTVDGLLAAGKHVLFAIDVQGALNLKKLYPTRALLIFVHPPSIEELQNRLIQRKGDAPEAIAKRLQNAYTEISWSQKFDYQITNDDLKKAYQQLKDIIQRECQ